MVCVLYNILLKYKVVHTILFFVELFANFILINQYWSLFTYRLFFFFFFFFPFNKRSEFCQAGVKRLSSYALSVGTPELPPDQTHFQSSPLTASGWEGRAGVHSIAQFGLKFGIFLARVSSRPLDWGARLFTWPVGGSPPRESITHTLLWMKCVSGRLMVQWESPLATNDFFTLSLSWGSCSSVTKSRHYCAIHTFLNIVSSLARHFNEWLSFQFELLLHESWGSLAPSKRKSSTAVC